MPTIVHFEIPTDNIERSKKFYNELFGWNIEKWSGEENMPEGMEYNTITTTDDKGNKGYRRRDDEKTKSTATRNYKLY
jgi:uncharacterized protein